MSIDDEAVTKVLEGLAIITKLEEELDRVRRYHLQTMLTLCVKAGGEIRVSEFDHLHTKGRSLATFVDPVTGDRVFVAKVVGEEAIDEPTGLDN